MRENEGEEKQEEEEIQARKKFIVWLVSVQIQWSTNADLVSTKPKISSLFIFALGATDTASVTTCHVRALCVCLVCLVHDVFAANQSKIVLIFSPLL